MRGIVITAVLLALPAAPAVGAELAGVTLPDTVRVGDATLVLNGLGLREATFLKVDVYVAGLYLPEKTGDADRILDGEGPRRLQMSFVRDVKRADLVKGFAEGFEKNSPEAMPALRARLDRLDGFLVDVARGDTLIFTWEPGRGVRVEIQGRERGMIEGADFGRALLAVWIGPRPPNAGLKAGLLGR
ncbi:MAG TPA: chalcone isomerase family protein [Candidatus Polarisedimenticolia bacterium]|nr:chalcone isomerase family protein [Candidatus Polarisedimenticolia bacterium]